jgi:lipid-binding SYLF domain-containing protein
MKAAAYLLSLCLVSFAVVSIGCESSTAPKNEAKRNTLMDESRDALHQMQTEDPTLQDFLNSAHGYVVFPSVGKGGLIAGGAYGRGIVYEQGNMIGYADLKQATVGAQIGGQTYSEVIALENKEAFDRFTSGKLTFSANVSAVALKSGAARAARYTDGVAVFVKPQGGMMAEASIGGQKFDYQPK